VDYDRDKVDDALMALNFHSDRYETRAWKSFDWDAMDRLYEKGFISDPKSKAKSVAMTDEGLARADELVEKFFGKR
jgi:hypothetical protein